MIVLSSPNSTFTRGLGVRPLFAGGLRGIRGRTQKPLVGSDLFSQEALAGYRVGPKKPLGNQVTSIARHRPAAVPGAAEQGVFAVSVRFRSTKCG